MRILIMLFGVSFVSCTSIGSRMIIEKKVTGTFEEVTQRVESKIKNENWELSKKFDFQKTLLEKKNKDVGAVISYKICKADHAYDLLKNENNKSISVMMPCSVNVYSKNGETYIAYMNLGLMKNFFPSDVAEVMGRVEAEIDEIVKIDK